MDSESIRIPEEYVDMLVQEFAYDPIRLSLTEDPAQVLYNRRTLENIWDANHDAVNPFTRQPWFINSIVTATPQEGGEFFPRFKEKLQNSDIGGVIVRVVELVLSGFKYLRSSHLKLAINIAAILYKEEGRPTRNEVVRVFEDFLGSEIVDEYDTVVKLSLKNIVDDVNVVEKK